MALLSSQKAGELLNREQFKTLMMEANLVGGAYITVDKETNSIDISGTGREVQKTKDCIVKNIYKITEEKDCLTISLTDNEAGLVVGEKGETIREIRRESKATVHLEGKRGHDDRRLFLRGSREARRKALLKIKDILKV